MIRRGGPVATTPILMPALMLVLVLAASACSRLGSGEDDQQYLDVGRDLIEGELADRIGLGPLEGSCQGRDLDPGDTFTCTAVTGATDPIRFVATVSDDGETVDLTSTNLLLADQVDQVEEFAASLIREETGLAIGAADFDCGGTSLVLEAGDVLDCLVTDPGDGTVYHAPVTVNDLTTMSVTVSVGDPVG